MTDFSTLGLSDRILQSVAASGYDTPTPIQKAAIPAVLEGHDIMGLAQTGTGKTAAFGLPLIEKLLANPQRPYPKSCRVLILAPTRELANQITTSLRGFMKKTPLKIATVVGGQSINVQIRDLGQGKDILVATPGRLLDLMERRAVILAQTHFLVLDEADQMLDLGFIHSLKQIARALPKERQTLLFSATMPKEIESLAKTYLNDPVRIEVSPSGKAADKVYQSVHFISQRGKTDLLKQHLAERADDLSLVFARTKHGAEKLMKHLVANGFSAASIHGNKSQGQRDRAIREF
ncbi:MAG: DEAD/DEAH box helicase, partial [Planctomycetes bacterium]|nr:DEAD/DEAH box helicase [Planctomycetota bacterium]